MGLTPEELYNHSFSEFFNRLEGWRSNQERIEREAWERTRFHVFRMVGMMSKKVKKPTDVLKLPWDQKPTSSQTELTEDQKRLLDKWDRIPVGTAKRVATVTDLMKLKNGIK